MWMGPPLMMAGLAGIAITFVYAIDLIPLGLAVLFMFMLVRKGEPPDRAG